MSKSKQSWYKTWTSMKWRCDNNIDKYKDITYCDEWKDSDQFHADMGDRPEGKTLDRIDGAMIYSPETCRWATPQEQSENRPTFNYNYNGMSLMENCRQRSLHYPTILGRIQRGSTISEALETPVVDYRIMYEGKTLAEVCRERGLTYRKIYTRIRRGMEIKTAIEKG
ncbi:putative HNH endonuclease [Synechococcus phage ACG-2014f]|uniref:Putative HNH endonuclease n=1 Tax=Synechococcus phage ACG-2014f TaxID=1493511 RepID=A0A0E3FIX4_9CAUD|nr:putative HNH endonuclease [Synechococcus phage ACG-2014f]